MTQNNLLYNRQSCAVISGVGGRWAGGAAARLHQSDLTSSFLVKSMPDCHCKYDIIYVTFEKLWQDCFLSCMQMSISGWWNRRYLLLFALTMVAVWLLTHHLEYTVTIIYQSKCNASCALHRPCEYRRDIMCVKLFRKSQQSAVISLFFTSDYTIKRHLWVLSSLAKTRRKELLLLLLHYPFTPPPGSPGGCMPKLVFLAEHIVRGVCWQFLLLVPRFIFIWLERFTLLNCISSLVLPQDLSLSTYLYTFHSWAQSIGNLTHTVE